jgi:hypothetical protein
MLKEAEIKYPTPKSCLESYGIGMTLLIVEGKLPNGVRWAAHLVQKVVMQSMN